MAQPRSNFATIEQIRGLHATLMAAASQSDDPRLERAFAAVPREAFMGPGPWRIVINGRQFETPTADPVHLYQNVLVALDPERGVNNGEPYLHAGWIGAVAPRPGESVTHIGAGTGYYSAILANLIEPGGSVAAVELKEDLARRARGNLADYPSVTVTTGDATRMTLPASDVIYVNAGATAPPASWIEALKPGGRLIFPWRPAPTIGLTLLVTRRPGGYAVKPLIPSWFIPCIGASDDSATIKPPDADGARQVKSLHLAAREAPDDSALAIYRDIWFSSTPVPDA